MDDGFGVARRVEAVAVRFQLAAQLAEVVDLAVEDDPNSLVLVVNRLMPRGQVDDAEPAHAEAHPALDVQPFIVGSAMTNDLAHAMREREVGVAPVPDTGP
jgi:hypothetical protein